jgi:hypothetical protein
VVKSHDSIWIFYSLRNCGTFNAHAVLLDGSLFFNKPVYCEEIRPATEEEKKELFDKLAEEGYEWKADTKELVKLKWKPIYGALYYKPGIRGAEIKAISDSWVDNDLDKGYYDKGWAFKTYEECQVFCNRLNNAINSVKP